MSDITIGVLALQGDFIDHARMIEELGVKTKLVKSAEDLETINGIIIPGGESFVIEKLAKLFGVFEPLRKKILDGMPVYGTCAGMIMLANKILDGNDGQEGLGVMNVTVRRNAFGRQVDSYEEDLEVVGLEKPFRGIFIRAPWVEEIGNEIEVLSRTYSRSSEGNIVAVRQKNMLATSFHPEVGKDNSFHELFVNMCMKE
ncbi:pyridoxal 5'-phosphate synthase glutaminase subunit PdxT [Actinomyces sp. zg-332]|uniref:pyridoxal 5'-phosphate synthase glutaminase subunit PdxT n=1 Tax=Actinomyces sp. zg-332 TaxID=2708340 RepID=UPI0014208C8C|nr:pyridoxal 5'-phosphate synthase glutaminase subunit PdxT [Actinomyces sp. zg-332]QPK93669.1 pyridoxal 5'-phosphate synthase glutaminase subunit PdxT [Actinomyces sp. zg-332]